MQVFSKIDPKKTSLKVPKFTFEECGRRDPRNKLVVITGLSGSGKSSLAFDTEGQRHRKFIFL
jgi:adenylylsulfate kinase-like enzyme